MIDKIIKKLLKLSDGERLIFIIVTVSLIFSLLINIGFAYPKLFLVIISVIILYVAICYFKILYKIFRG